MYFPIKVTPKLLLFFTILIPSAIDFCEAYGGKSLNIRIGFDLTQGKNGVPALRIRDFKDTSEYKPRADESDGVEKASPGPAIRADSFSDSNEDNKPERDESSREETPSSDEEKDRDSDPGEDYKKHRSTKGMDPADFEPEENPNIHSRYKDDEDEEEEEGYARYKRGAENSRKMKGKKVRGYRKLGVIRRRHA